MLMQLFAPVKPRAELGYSLVQLMVAVGLIGILALVTSKVFGTQFRSQANYELSMEKLDLRGQILTGIDCNWTNVTARPCAAGDYITVGHVVSKDTPPLIAKFDPGNPAATTKLGQFLVRAKVGPSHNLIIETQPSLNSNATWTDLSNHSIPIGCYLEC